MPSPSEPILPPEVIDLIIDYLHVHRGTLRACSLVGRNWLGGSRHHLFDGVYLAARDLGTFQNLLESPDNTLLFHIRNLHATRFQYHELTRLLQLLPAFSHLHSLSIYGNTTGPIQFVDQPRWAETFPFIDSLTLSRATFASYPGLSDFLCRFPALKTLALDHVSAPFSPSAVPAAVNIDLDTLKITLTTGLFGWLQWTGFSLRTQSLEVDFESTEMRPSDYLAALGTRLERLKLKFRQPGQLENIPRNSWLMHNTRLRCLRVGYAFWIRSETDISSPPSLGRLLKQLESSGIEELSFDAEILEWPRHPPHEVAAILDEGVFPRLRRIEFFGPWDRAEDILRKQFQSAMLALLPIQSSRGIVHVNAHPSQ
ncbi:hypothetical protein B0H14DRAFT_2771355 [Mycena olivaceomarginata]|nr:hypothetical protein B0H14DRAFT_2771355 [Mycena olivaceomarginata]